MTTITAPAQPALAAPPATPREFDHQQRAQAKRDSHPVVRTAARGLWAPNAVDRPTETYVAMLNATTGQLNLIDVTTGVRSTTRVAGLAAWLGLGPDARDSANATKQLVFATRADLYALVSYCKAARKSATDADSLALGQAARVVDVAMSLPMQGRIAALTSALTDCYYLPLGLNEKSLSDWATAFGHGQATTSHAMLALVRLASDDRRTVDLEAGSKATANPMSNPEMHALASAAYGSTGMSAIKAHRNADRTNETHRGVLRADETLLPRHLLSGEVTQVTILNKSHLSLSGVVSQPFVMKAGRGVNVMFADRLGLVGAEARITSVRVMNDDDSQLIVGLTGTARHASRMSRESSFYIFQTSFANSTKARGQRWVESAGANLHDVPERDVPLDIMLAGAPS